jgi:hypothetical protein
MLMVNLRLYSKEDFAVSLFYCCCHTLLADDEKKIKIDRYIYVYVCGLTKDYLQTSPTFLCVLYSLYRFRDFFFYIYQRPSNQTADK